MFEWCCRCQTADWRAHRKVCITPVDRKQRVVDLVMTQMKNAHALWDSTRVISLGAQAEADLLIIAFPLKEKVEIERLDMMARAFSRTAEYSKALEYFERLLALYDPVDERKEHTRAKICIADMDVVLKHFDKAKVRYKEVFSIGEDDGNFEFHSKSCLGLCRVEKEAGNKARALEFAEQALAAADLLLDIDYSKQRDQAQALVEIISLLDLESKKFDENLITRLHDLAKALDTKEPGGTSWCVKAAEIQWRRHWHMSRWIQCANACMKTMQLAQEDRFKQKPDVQKASEAALQAITELQGLGFIAMNPGR